MLKALITGSEGLVGRYLRAELAAAGYEVTGIDLFDRDGVIRVDLLDPEATEAALEQVKPDVIFHLAGQPDVGKSWKIPQKTFAINVLAAINLMEGMRKFCPEAPMVIVGSADEYGSLKEAGASVSEETPMNPMNPYAISKDAQEKLGKAYAKAYGLKICMTRSFNHGGAGQRTGFMIPDFASGIVKVERGEADCKSLWAGPRGLGGFCHIQRHRDCEGCFNKDERWRRGHSVVQVKRRYSHCYRETGERT